MAEHLVYMRQGPGLPSLEEQKVLLRRAGADPDQERAWTDLAPRQKPKPSKGDLGFPERARCIRAGREGDTLHIPVLGVLGVSTKDGLAVFKELSRRRVTVRVAVDGMEIAPDAGLVMVEAADRIEYESQLRRTNKARVAAGERAKLTRDQQAAQWAVAAEMWTDPANTVKAIHAKSGISPSTLYRAAREGLLPERRAMPVKAAEALKPKRRTRK